MKKYHLLRLGTLEIPLTLSIILIKARLMMYHLNLELPWKILLFNCGLLMVLTAGAYLMRPLFRRGFLCLLNLSCSFLFFTDLLHYRYFNIPLTAYSFLQTSNLNGLGESILALARMSDLLLFTDLLIWPVFFFFTAASKLPKSRFIFAFQLILGLALTCFYPVQQTYYEKNDIFRRFDTAMTFHHFGPLGFHSVDTAYYLMDKNIALTDETEDLILAWFDNREQPDADQFFSALQGGSKGKNLIVIQVESLQNFVIGQTVAGQPITPNLNELLGHSFYYRHFYPQTVDGNSSDAELVVNSSLYPIRKGSTFFSYPGNQYHSLPLLLKPYGYQTVAVHSDEASFWNRHLVYPNLGFDEFWDIDKFAQTDLVGMGLSDMAMFEQSAAMLKELPQPFYSFIITLTSHYPYSMPSDQQFLELPPALDGSHVGNYLQAVRYTDQAIGGFMQELKQNGLLDNSLVVIYGDHDGLFERDKPQLEELWAGKTISGEEWVREYMPVPLIIYQPDFEGKRPGGYGGQVDVLPTIAYLMGFEQEAAHYAMGKNLLTPAGGFAIIPRGDYIKQMARVTPDRIDYDWDPDSEVGQTLQVADLIIRTNFFAISQRAASHAEN
ncbi:LTA synthase family protein [Syntrophobotulus glycolicus]|nr:LTA synthase family protein [Syntrophobotulus glycolicus]